MKFPSNKTKPTTRAKRVWQGSAGALALLLFLGYHALFTVNEWEQAIIIQFGDIKGDPVTEAGVHLKIPFIQNVEKFERRLLRWDGRETTTITKDRKTVVVDVSARWRINDARRFRQSVGSERLAGLRLNGIIEGAVKDEIAKYDLYQVVRSSNRILDADSGLREDVVVMEEDGTAVTADLASVLTSGDLAALRQDEAGLYLSGRPVVLTGILQEARTRLEQVNLGIHLEDLLIKQLNYSSAIEANVYAQMNAELQKISAGFRSSGRERAEEKLGRMERELASIHSLAVERAERIHGDAEAAAINIYAEAYNRDPAFFTFVRTLDAYTSTLSTNTTLIIGADSPIYQGLITPLK